MTGRRLSLLKPTGHLTLGNYLGALRPMVTAQNEALADGQCFYGVCDLHAMTVAHDPARLRALTTELATLLLAVGLDRSTLFVQSRVPAHTELAYLLECTAYTGELNRMIQFKEKGRGVDATRVSLYTYPVLMAADILLYRPEQVPVGDDQRQHLELTRDLALRFNRTYGPVFTVPEISTPPAGARVMSLSDPTSKMGKSDDDDAGNLYLLDPPDVIRRKVARAVTDSDTGRRRRARRSRGQARRDQPAGDPGRVRRLRRRTRDLRRPEGRRHRRRGGRAGAAAAQVRRARRRQRPRLGRVRRRRGPLPRGDGPGARGSSRRCRPAREELAGDAREASVVRTLRRARASGRVRPPSPPGTPPAPCGSRAHAGRRRWCRQAR